MEPSRLDQSDIWGCCSSQRRQGLTVMTTPVPTLGFHS
jgi:hypothetical protein